MKLQRSLILITAACLLSGTAIAKQDELPAVSHDGLELRKGKAAVVYVRPGVDFSGYQRFAILECPVAFSKDWERERKSGAARVSQKDMDEMKADLSAEFLKIFTDELQNKGGYQIVTTGAEDVLILRPAIIDLEVSVPDSMSAGRSYTLSESAGGMTLYLEIFDSVTGQILARAIDRQEDRGTGRIQWQNSVTNKAEADRMLRRWASALRERLDEVNGKAPAK
ncbi:MAG: DUF3313 family protein [Chromatiales bacterium]|nr:DUF3313 family protein [Chromatiales bacterium]